MRPLFHFGERESSRIVLGLNVQSEKINRRAILSEQGKCFFYAKLNAIAEFLMEIQREFSP